MIFVLIGIVSFTVTFLCGTTIQYSFDRKSSNTQFLVDRGYEKPGWWKGYLRWITFRYWLTGKRFSK